MPLQKPQIRFLQTLNGPIQRVLHHPIHGYVRMRKHRVGGSFATKYYPVNHLNERRRVVSQLFPQMRSQSARPQSAQVGRSASRSVSQRPSAIKPTKKPNIAQSVSKLLRGGSISMLA